MSDETQAPTEMALEPIKPQPIGEALPPDQIKAPVTAAQGKVDAIANLTMNAYQRAGTLELSPEQSAALQEPFPNEAFKPGAGGKEHLIYIEHAFLRDRLNKVLGLGQWALIPRSRWAEDFTTQKGTKGVRVYVEAMLVIKGCMVAESIGEMEYYPKNESQNYGDAVEGATTAALRRCCKQFGVGLQAWSRDFCDGWWQWQRSKGRPAQSQASPKTPPPSTPTQPPKASPGASQGPPQAKKPPRTPEESKKRWIDLCVQAGGGGAHGVSYATDYYRDKSVGGLLPNENLIDLPIEKLPKTKDEANAILTAIAALSGAAMDVPPEFDQQEDGQDQPWFRVIVPVPHKGESRDEYLKHPDTIGSLYAARHGTDDLSQEARQRLWGFVEKYEPKGWTKRDGTQMPASKSDKDFRIALDQFQEWFDKTHPDEKL